MPPSCSSQLVQGKVLKLSKGGFAQDRCLSIKVPDTCVLRYKFRALDLIKRCTFIYFLSIPEDFQVILYRDMGYSRSRCARQRQKEKGSEEGRKNPAE